MIKTNNLKCIRNKKEILKGINFHAPRGQVISLLGPNGSGKSTLLKCIINILKTDKQKIYINNKSLAKYNAKQLSKEITFIPQIQGELKGLTVYEVISLGRQNSWHRSKDDEDKIIKAIQFMKLESKVNSKIHQLSGGERQKVLIAMALAKDTPIIIMDEPVTYMDIKNQWELLEVIQKLKNNFNKTIIVVFHDINHALEVSDMIYLIKNGKIFTKGKPEEVITKCNIKKVFDIDTHIFTRHCNKKRCQKLSIIPAGA